MIRFPLMDLNLRSCLPTAPVLLGLIVLLLIGLVGLEGCTIQEPLRVEPFESGVLILEAKQPQRELVSVAFINRQSGLYQLARPKPGNLSTDIFNNLNDRTLSDAVFSYAEVNGKGFLVLSGKGQLEVVEGSTFRSIAQIGGAEGGRYVVGLNSLKAYVSCWGGQTMGANVSIIDLTTRDISGRIPVAAGPEQMVLVGDELFVANSGGNTGEPGKTVSIINTTTDQLVTTIAVGDVPTSMVYDADAKLLYVLCTGRPVNGSANGLTTAELIRIDPAKRQVVSRVTIGGRAIAGNVTNLTFDPQTKTLYFLWRGNVHKAQASATSITLDQPLVRRSLTNYGYDPVTATIYGASTNRSAKPGVVLRYQTTGALIDSLSIEAVPTGFYFK